MFVPLPVPFVFQRTASDFSAWRLKSSLAPRSSPGKTPFHRSRSFHCAVTRRIKLSHYGLFSVCCLHHDNVLGFYVIKARENDMFKFPTFTLYTQYITYTLPIFYFLIIFNYIFKSTYLITESFSVIFKIRANSEAAFSDSLTRLLKGKCEQKYFPAAVHIFYCLPRKENCIYQKK